MTKKHDFFANFAQKILNPLSRPVSAERRLFRPAATAVKLHHRSPTRKTGWSRSLDPDGMRHRRGLAVSTVDQPEDHPGSEMGGDLRTADNRYWSGQSIQLPGWKARPVASVARIDPSSDQLADTEKLHHFACAVQRPLISSERRNGQTDRSMVDNFTWRRTAIQLYIV